MLFTEVPSGAHCLTRAQAASVTVAVLPHTVEGGLQHNLSRLNKAPGKLYSCLSE